MEMFKKLNDEGPTIVQVTHSEVNAGDWQPDVRWKMAGLCQAHDRLIGLISGDRDFSLDREEKKGGCIQNLVFGTED